MKAPKEKLKFTEPPPSEKPLRPAPVYAGDIERKCSNCQHFEPMTLKPREGDCRNGISGRFKTRAIDGCAYGFYPSITKFPLKAGPGGSR